MKFDLRIHHRRSIRLKEYDYTQPGAYFITLVTQDRANLFGEIIDGVMRLNVLGEIICSNWLRLPNFFPIRHEEWVIMPNHLHAIIWILDSDTGEASVISNSSNSYNLFSDALPQSKAIGTKPGSLGAIIQNFKSISTRKINRWTKDSRTGEASATVRHETPKPLRADASPQHIWQRNYFEHIIRSQPELERIRQYIAGNPSQWTADEENPGRSG